MKVVVDTNVAVTANGINTHACIPCQLKCIEFLESSTKTSSATRFVLDESGLIFEEYRSHLSFRGQPGLGDAFFKYLHDYQYYENKVLRVAITPTGDRNGFSELPANNVDPSDQKFLAVALVSNASIINAVENDWSEQSDLLANLAVNVKQLCPEELK